MLQSNRYLKVSNLTVTDKVTVTSVNSATFNITFESPTLNIIFDSVILDLL